MRESILLLALYIGAAVIFLLGVVLHEAGHLAGGLLSGYRFVSFRIFSWVLFKEDQKLRFRRSRQGFVVGQCLMAPPEEGEAFRFMLYNLGGGLFNAIATVLCLLLGACFFGSEYSVFAFIGFAINGVLAMGNLIPSGVKGIPNDGMNVKMARKSKDAAHGLWLMLKINAALAQGKRLRDFAQNTFCVPPDADMKNYLVAHICFLEAGRREDSGDFAGCVAIYNSIDLECLPGFYRNSALLDVLYYAIVHQPDAALAEEIMARKGIAKFLARTKTPAMLRISAAYAFYRKGNRTEGRKQLEKAIKVNNSTPNRGIAAMEADQLALLEAKFAEEEAQNDHPWH